MLEGDVKENMLDDTCVTAVFQKSYWSIDVIRQPEDTAVPFL